MTRDEAKQWIPILQAYADGKAVQYMFGTKWGDATSLSFDDSIDRYRVRPEPTYRPWTEQEIEAECIKGTVLREKRSRLTGALSRFDRGYAIGSVVLGQSLPIHEYLFEDCVIAATGAPCGVLE